jgi:hypothetical protein
MALELAALREQGTGDGVPSGDALAAARARITELEGQLAAKAARGDAEQRLEQLNADVRDALASLAETQGLDLVARDRVDEPGLLERHLTAVVGIVALLLGFGAGFAYFDYRIRRRYRGLRL